MIILGVDPGTATMGYGILEKTGNRFRALAYGALETPKTMPTHERLRELYHGLRGLCETFQPDALVTEQLLFQTNRRTAIAVARAAGIALLVAAEQGIEWREYTPLQVKQAVTGYGGADKKNRCRRWCNACWGWNRFPSPMMLQTRSRLPSATRTMPR